MTTTHVQSISSVGPRTVALRLAVPAGFEAYPGQFVLVRATIDGREESGHYTLSSPTVTDSFEITVEVDPDGTLGPWLADRERGDSLEFDGPFGATTYEGNEDVVVLASGPGIGPAVGIGERARATGAAATICYDGDEPAHADRLEALREDGAEVVLGTSELEERLVDVDDADEVYVFGFESFVEVATEALSEADLDPTAAHVENFGPE